MYLMFEDTMPETRSASPTTATRTSKELGNDDLVRLAVAGDEAAFGIIFERYRRLVVYLVGKFFRRPEEIEDMSQQAFTKIYFSLKDFRGENEGSFKSWLSRLTVNSCYDELRRRGRRAEELFSDFSDDEREYLETIASDDGTATENRVVARDLAAKILGRLDPDERIAMTLLHAEEMSVAEVAKVVGWSESKVKTRLFRCRTNLRSVFSHIFKR